MTRKMKLFSGGAAVVVAFVGAAFALINPSPNTENEVTAPASQEAGHGDEHEEGGVVEMTAADRKAKGVTTAPVDLRVLTDEAVVPGEVTLDIYRSAQIAPRISAQIVARQARLGDHVTAGQALVTLSSVEMADAQGNLIVATREWSRVRELGREVVSERRYVEAQVAAEQARAKLLAFGMTSEQIEGLVKIGDASKATGMFDLLAPQDGTVVKDDFVVGEVVEAGRVLFQITNESRVWVQAQLTPEQAAHAEVGSSVRILIDKDHVSAAGSFRSTTGLTKRRGPCQSVSRSTMRATNSIPANMSASRLESVTASKRSPYRRRLSRSWTEIRPSSKSRATNFTRRRSRPV